MHNRLHNHFKTRKAEAGVPSAAIADAEPVADVPDGYELTRRASRSLASHPALAIGAAFAIGLLVGKWVKR
jgi:hypothetical protein